MFVVAAPRHRCPCVFGSLGYEDGVVNRVNHSSALLLIGGQWIIIHVFRYWGRITRKQCFEGIRVRDQITPQLPLATYAGQSPPPLHRSHPQLESLPLQPLLNVHAPLPLQQVYYLQVALQVAARLRQVGDARLHRHLLL